jgi:DNA-binding MurR/RpiR family transcriptional regulator
VNNKRRGEEKMKAFDSSSRNTETIDRIVSHYDSYSEVERRVADYILENQEGISSMTTVELARNCQTSPASIIRFSKAIGFKGFNELKYYMENQILSSYGIEQAIGKDDDIAMIKQKFAKLNQLIIDDTMQMLDNRQLEIAIDKLVNANRILVIGEGGSGAICISTYNLFLQLGLPCAVETDAFLQVMATTHLNENDVVIAMIHSGRSKNTLDSMRQAKKNGATVICITGYQKSPMSEEADIVLYSTTRSTLSLSDVPSARISELCIIGVLQLGILAKNFNKYTVNIEKSKEAYKLKRI